MATTELTTYKNKDPPRYKIFHQQVDIRRNSREVKCLVYFRKFSFITRNSNLLLGISLCNYQLTQPIPSAIFFIQILRADIFLGL